MGTIHFTPRAAILGIALTLLTIPILYNFASVPHFQEDGLLAPLEFTDVRIVRLNLSGPHSEPNIVQRITIDSEFNYHGCHSNSSAALPCPVQLWDEKYAWLWEHMRTQQSIPSL